MSNANTHLNPAKSSSFAFVLSDSRKLTFRVQNAPIASMNLGAAPYPTRTMDLLVPGNKIDFDPVVLKFFVSEDLTEWFDLYELARDITKSNAAHLDHVTNGELTIFNSEGEEVARITYVDMFPLTIGSLQYSIIDDEFTLTLDVTFQYDRLNAVQLNTGRTVIYE